ncbi:MAG: hybrid sensor histidine kinase/response regulator, partial [Bryobacteraceae bacterium]
HELRTPLHTIIGFAELLSEGLEGPLGDKQLRFVNHILRDGRHLLELINDILDLSKIEAGRLELKIEHFEWTGALAEVIATIQPQAVAKGVTLSATEIAPYPLYADRVRFKAILYNLLSNAVKFTPSGGRVWVEAAVQDQVLVLSVRDTGIGITIDQQARIFDKFYQAGMTTKGVREGTGLGLAITKHFVERHGGSITVESTPGHGSSFNVMIPLNRRDVEARPAQLSDVPTKPLVLIVDADAAARELMVDYLEHHGYRTEVAGSSDEGLRKARSLRPDAITLDLLIPGAEGWKTMRELRSDPQTLGIPVLLVSRTDAKQDATASGPVAYLVKPVDCELLLNMLRRHVRARPGNPPKILVVDDEQSSLQLLQEVLGRAGYIPILNSSGRDALETLAKTHVSAAVVDLMMPEMNGFEFILRLKENPRLEDLPLLVLTAKELSGQDFEVLRKETKAIFLKGATWREDLVSQLRKLVPAIAAASER